MAEPVRNRRSTVDLDEEDVQGAIERLAGRDLDRGRDAQHVYDTLTWGEGPSRIDQAGVQRWLWYELPTKYMTDEPGYMTRLAAVAAELFDELGLDAYALVCRSPVTAGVHAAFDRSRGDGFAAMREAFASSGIDPPDLDSLAWGQVMGTEEAMARAAAEGALEEAIGKGELVVGGRGWRARQREITERVLDSDHPSQPGQTWRTAVVTERIGTWVDAASMRSPELGRRRARLSKRLLHPILPPPDVAERTAPLTWLLEAFGDEQALTQAGYLNTAFVLTVHAHRPWEDPFPTDRPPRTETDEITLHRLRGFLETAGALRKRRRVLQRTQRGAAMATDPAVAWLALVERLGSNPWNRFVTETCGLVLLEGNRPMAEKEVTAAVVDMAGEAGWRTSGDRGDADPSARDVAWAFSDSRTLLTLFGLLDVHGDWGDRRYHLTPAGETTMLAMLRATATGPRERPW
jgi:hypothetical protein